MKTPVRIPTAILSALHHQCRYLERNGEGGDQATPYRPVDGFALEILQNGTVRPMEFLILLPGECLKLPTRSQLSEQKARAERRLQEIHEAGLQIIL